MPQEQTFGCQEPIWFDRDFDRDYAICGNSTIDEKVEVAIGVLTKSPIVRSRVQELIEGYERRGKYGQHAPGDCLSNSIRNELVTLLSTEVME